MKPVRLTIYRWLSLTRRTYLLIQAVVLVAMLAMIGTGAWAMLTAGRWLPQPGRLSAYPPPPREELVLQSLGILFWAGLLALVLEAIETAVVLRRFRRAEAEEQARSAASPDAPSVTDRPPAVP